MSRDLRQYARQTNVRLLIGLFLLLFVVGLGLIYTFYGLGGVVTGFFCILGGLAPLGLIWLVLWGMEWFVKRNDR
ncbi:MAG: hypothetical protein HUU38_23110 [Anaerolineales bacterium]|jgi:hypothetical protein|nr:hypothetical protein [Anaerolineales bacterium]